MGHRYYGRSSAVGLALLKRCRRHGCLHNAFPVVDSAPPQDYDFYFSPFEANFETDPGIYFAVAIANATTAAFIVILLYQLSSLRRQRFAFHAAAEETHRTERRRARELMKKQSNRIKDLHEAWRIKPNRIKFDALIATGTYGQVWRGRMSVGDEMRDG